MSEKKRFSVRDLLEIYDNESGNMIATAVSRNRAIMIAAALNTAYGPPADQYRVFWHSYGDSGLGVYRVMSPIRIVATCEDVNDANQICDRLNDINSESEA